MIRFPGRNISKEFSFHDVVLCIVIVIFSCIVPYFSGVNGLVIAVC